MPVVQSWHEKMNGLNEKKNLSANFKLLNQKKMEGNLINVFLNFLISGPRGHCDYSSRTQKEEEGKNKEKTLVDMHFPILGPPLTNIRGVKSSPARSDTRLKETQKE
jgi:hypothetical protein